MNYELLFKTNPNEPNLVRRPVHRSSKSEGGSFSEGGFSRPYNR